MPGNLHRGTPGRALAIFAACLAGVTVLSIHKWWERRDFEEVRFPTGLGDTLYYTPSDADFEEALLAVPQPGGTALPLYRQNINPVEKPDERMLKVGRATKEDFWFYVDSNDGASGRARRFFLKTGEGNYVEFREERRRSPSAEPAGPSAEPGEPSAAVPAEPEA